jgi:hypothetical protein
MAKYNDFNPVKEDASGVRAKRVVWSTKTLDMALKGIEQGKKLVSNPFYENNTKLLKGDLVFERTQEEINEWKRCKNDIIYFVEKYCQLMTPEGIKHVKLRDYQEKYLRHLEDNRLSIYLACRQCGKTTTSAVFMLHYVLFNIDKNALVLGNKRKTAVEILDKAKKIYLELPFFLRPGIYKWNEAEIVLDNGCRLMAEATTKNSGISFTFHCVLADEFAHVAPNILDDFYNNLFPVVTAGKARFMITSTQNGYNLFYRLYKAAEQGISEYKAFKTDWYEVPEWNPDTRKWEKRDEAWHRLQVANYGSEEAFNKQFGTNFDVSANTLISQFKLRAKKNQVIEFEPKDIIGVPHADYYKWNPNYEPMNNLKKDHIVITCDLAEGVMGDYTVFKFYKVFEDHNECIGYFRCNNLIREQCAYSLQLFICKHMNINNVLLSYEKNTYGDLFYRDLMDNFEKDEFISRYFDPSIIVKYYNEAGTKYSLGIKLTPGNKTPHCLLYKESYERDQTIDNDTDTYSEILSFINDGTNHYKASFGHDDMVMASVQLEFVKNTLQYKLLKETLPIEGSNNDDTYYNPYETPFSWMYMEEEQSNRLKGWWRSNG